MEITSRVSGLNLGVNMKKSELLLIMADVLSNSTFMDVASLNIRISWAVKEENRPSIFALNVYQTNKRLFLFLEARGINWNNIMKEYGKKFLVKGSDNYYVLDETKRKLSLFEVLMDAIKLLTE